MWTEEPDTGLLGITNWGCWLGGNVVKNSNIQKVLECWSSFTLIVGLDDTAIKTFSSTRVANEVQINFN